MTTLPTISKPLSKSKLARIRRIYQVVAETFLAVHLQPEVICRAVLVYAGLMEILFIVLDTRRIEGSLSAYLSKDLLHQISTNLKGMPVAISNTTGFRFAILLSKPPDLPRMVELPNLKPGRLQIGVGIGGKLIALAWDTLGHLLVPGMTRSGKSSFLRSLAFQAIVGGDHLLLGDLPQTTFPMLENHPALLAPVAERAADYPGLVTRALEICDQRRDLFRQSPEYPEKVSEYNTWAVRHGKDPLPRVFVILDEYNAAAIQLGRKLTDPVASLAAQGLKFGVHLVLSAQMFDKGRLGDVRDQFGAVIAFRVKSSTVARNVGVAGAERIPADRPGLAMSDRWGLVQTCYLPKQRLIDLGGGERINLLTDEQRAWVQRALKETDGRMSIPILKSWGLPERQARKLLSEWELRGWLKRDPQRDNARYITSNLLSNHRQTITDERTV